ncbi:hypothetical protein [Pseudoflavitalea rhizosphaerae]|uniref:hypothetical protein n=1 Tax=Pseudoflavitalea rhizosphaerae TaxID=1884793 RepID=UPI000F8D0D08|nr:hypothetical protein [Pseudoflavitalea rhizosphaerae]
MQSDKPKYKLGYLTEEQVEGIQHKVDQTNVFPLALQRAGFTKVDEITYVKGENEKIRIFCQEGKWKYQNLKNLSDKGSLLDFINRRLPIKNKNGKRNLDFSAITALDYYNIHLKAEKKKAGLTAARELDTKIKTASEQKNQSLKNRIK